MNKCMNRLVKRSIKIITENNETINITPNSPLLPEIHSLNHLKYTVRNAPHNWSALPWTSNTNGTQSTGH